MTQIKLASDTPTIHTISFRTPASFKDKLTREYEKEKDNLAIVDKYINDFNQQNNNSIAEYNYEINTETNFNVCILFKHLFRAIGETQKCARCNVDIGNNEVNIKFDKNIDIHVKTKTKYDDLPLTSIRASYVVDGDEILNTIQYETHDDVSGYKCYTMLMSMIQDGIMNVVDNVEKTDT
jgi:hypothetical protein